MSFQKYLERLKYLDFLIKKKATGNAACLAKKLRLSKSGTEKFLKEIRELGVPVCYCKKSHTYYYLEEGKVVEQLFDKELDKVEMKKTNGGKNIQQYCSDRNYSRYLQDNFTY